MRDGASDFVIIGGVAAGPKTAATLARRLPDARITLFQKEERISYGTCGLPYFASGDINSFDELTMTSYGVPRSVEFFKRTKGFDVLTGAEVIRIDRDNKTVTVKLIKSGEIFEHGYGKLVLATGSVPNKPPFPVAKSPKIRPFIRPDDAISFRIMAQEGKIDRVLIVGGGFIGCELAEAAGGLWGIEVTLIEKENQLLSCILDREMAMLVERELTVQGIEVITDCDVERFDLNGDGNPVVSIKGRESITADFAFLCLGVKPEVTLAAGCGLALGRTGAIVVNRYLQTSDPNIFAGGDCIESVHQITGDKVFMPMGSLANRQGYVIAENLAGGSHKFPGVLGTFLLKVFDINVGAVGLSYKAAEVVKIKAETVWGTFPDRPDYYPESKTFTLKIVYSPDDGRLLGLQAVGAGDICRRIDLFSSFLQRKATVDDLLDFEHGYAPPYSEALDPLHHLAAMARAQRGGLNFISPGFSFADLDDDLILLDIRQPDEVESEPLTVKDVEKRLHLVNIPLDDLRENLDKLDRKKKVMIICKRGPRSYQAALILKKAGFDDVHLMAGGTSAIA